MTLKHETAAILVIGNEILSGRTHELNAHLAAKKLFKRGCKVGEILIVPDTPYRIINALNRLTMTYDAVITSGGIGPTHDDITMHAVAEAMDVPLVEHKETLEVMRKRYGTPHLNAGRRRMARLPKGAVPIITRKSIAPGAFIGNVYVLAGVPEIFACQLQAILKRFGSQPFVRREIEVELPESIYADELEKVQSSFPRVEIGSYPSHCGNFPRGKICLSSRDEQQLSAAMAAVRRVLSAAIKARH